MPKQHAVVLKPDREIHAKNKHPWVFLGAVQSFPTFENGDLLPVETSAGTHLGYGYFNAGQSIVGRMVSFDSQDPMQSISTHIQNALLLRKQVVPKDTTAYRVINGEGDNLPGLIVDLYNDVLVLQINTLGMERLKEYIVQELTTTLAPRAIYEKSASATRKKEGLPEAAAWLVGSAPQPITITEHGITFQVDISQGQKTGFFLDQREMRLLAKQYAADKTVLNCFGYTGGFSMYALAGHARSVDTIDLDAEAIHTAQANAAANGFTGPDNQFYTQDVFAFLRQKQLPKPYDFIILDPPAFAKKSRDVENAVRGYREINRLALEHLPNGGLLLTSSCSSHIDSQQFQTILFQAAKDAKREIKILSYHILAPDHPVNLFFPEGDYLKSLLLCVV